MSDEQSGGAVASPMFGFVRSPQDFFGGIALIVISAFSLYAGSDLPGIQGFSFGPGTAPRLFAGLLMIFGFIITAMGVVLPGPPLERVGIRGAVLAIASILVFATTIRPLGLIISSYVAFMVGAAATDEVRWREAVIVGAVLTAGCVVLFTYILNLPFQLWPNVY
jgi:putative tricarboxylic transport membrane protein